jgi:glycine/D-amino acid oxidase-like deaminating enzyme
VFDRERIGWGASSRNGGQVLTGLRLEPAVLVRRFGERRARELFDAALRSIDHLEDLLSAESIECGYARVGHIQAAWKPSHFDAFRDEATLLTRTFGHRVQLVARDAQRSEIGSDRYHGLLVDERSGALNPARYVAGLACAARRAGAAIAEHTPVTAISTVNHSNEKPRWRVRTAAGDVEAAEVLLATNGYTDAVSSALRRRLVPVGSYIIATEPLPPEQAAALLPRGRMAFDSKHFLYYFRVTSDHRLLFGGRAEFGQPATDTIERAASTLRAGMVEVFPRLANARIEYAWGGAVAFTRDQMPRAGRLDGLFYAGGYCGHGIAMATWLGDEIARRMAGEPVANPLFDDEFRPIPLYSGTPWFLPAVGAYYQVKDWLA